MNESIRYSLQVKMTEYDIIESKNGQRNRKGEIWIFNSDSEQSKTPA